MGGGEDSQGETETERQKEEQRQGGGRERDRERERKIEREVPSKFPHWDALVSLVHVKQTRVSQDKREPQLSNCLHRISL